LTQITATSVTIGDEILIGQITDTNSQWIASEFGKLGVTVEMMLSISDTENAIQSVVKNQTTDLLVLTGGLGPTKDDITKHTLAKFFNTPLVVHQETLQRLTTYYAARKRSLNELNETQAQVPQNCIVLKNDFGTAPGMWFQENEKVIVSLPGVPLEMKKLMGIQVIPKLRSYFSTPYIYHKTLHTIGIAESDLAIKIKDWENGLPKAVKLAYLPSLGMVRLRLSLQSSNRETAENLVQPLLVELKKLINHYVYGEDGDLIEQVVGELLLKKNKTLATAESCTGGNIGQLITSIAGSSQYFNGGLISYSNEVKIKSLHVPSDVIDKYGAVSEQTVSFMSTNVCELLHSDYGIAVSGIAGPGGGTDIKPVGTVWLALSSEKGTITKKLVLTPHREKNIRLASIYALDLLRKQLLKS
jgi:nicotinamide-nucleotide amidase